MSLASLTVCLSVPGRPDLFAALLQPVTDGVNANFSHASGHLYVPVEVDACRSDPHPQPGGCMTQRAMTKLDEIGFLRALYAPAATADKDPACGPAVVAQLEVASGNVSAAAVESIMGDYCWPVGVGNASRPTVDEALAAAGSALAAKGLTMPPWHAINFRMPLDPMRDGADVHLRRRPGGRVGLRPGRRRRRDAPRVPDAHHRVSRRHAARVHQGPDAPPRVLEVASRHARSTELTCRCILMMSCVHS